MSIRCPRCGKQYDVVAFEGARPVRCTCGLMLDLSLMETVEDFLRYFESEEERKKAHQIQHEAGVICRMILDENCPEVDIEIAKARLREKVQQFFPDKLDVYSMIYEARFNRLWQQFRAGGSASA